MIRSPLLLVFIVLSFFPLSALAQSTHCAAPSSASQYCMGSSGPISVGKGEMPTCIPGCTYTISDTANGKQISASFSSSACVAYESHITRMGRTTLCNPGDDTSNVIPTVDNSFAAPAVQTSVDGVARTSHPKLEAITSSTNVQATQSEQVGLKDYVAQTSAKYCVSNDMSGIQCDENRTQATGTQIFKEPKRDAIDLSALLLDITPDESERNIEEEGDVTLQVRGAVGTLQTPTSAATRAQAATAGAGDADVNRPTTLVVGGASQPSWLDSLFQTIMQLVQPNGRSSAIEARAQLAQAAGAPAAPAPSTSGESAKCFGGEVFVYSKDFSDMPNSVAQPAKVRKFQCNGPRYVGSSVTWMRLPESKILLNFKQYLNLSSATACEALTPQASGCAIVYAAVVPDRSQPVDPEFPNRVPSVVRSQACNPAIVPQHSPIQFSGCVSAENQIRAKFGQVAENPGAKPYTGAYAPPSTPPQSYTDIYKKWGSPTVSLGGTWHVGGGREPGSPPSALPSENPSGAKNVWGIRGGWKF